MTRIGFAGLGLMGLPMAGRLLDAGRALTVWARRPEAAEPLVARGATLAPHPDALFAASDTVVLMLRDEDATDDVLGRGTDRFAPRVAGRLLVVMSTHTPAYSAQLASEVRAAGGRYVEAPVSGSRVPAERGELVVMTSGDDDPGLAALFAPLAREVVPCGAVPNALRTKIAVNHYMMAMVAALVESLETARAAGIDVASVARVLAASPMDSAIGRVKTEKLLAGDASAQAAIADVVKNCGFAVAAAREAGVATPVLDVVDRLYRATADAGYAESDIIAVGHVLCAIRD